MLKEYRWITALLVALTLVFGYFGEIWHHGKVVSEHLFTEMIATLLTVVGIEYVVHRGRQRDALPRRATAYTDVCSYVNSAIGVWFNAFRDSVPVGNDPQTIEEFFTVKTMRRIWVHLNLDAVLPKSTPPMKWVDRLVRHGQWLKAGGEPVLGRNGQIDAQVFADLHKLTYGQTSLTFPWLMQMKVTMLKIRKQPTDPNVPTIDLSQFPTLHNSGPAFDQEELDAMNRLIQWCRKEHAALVKHKLYLKDEVRYRAYRAEGDPLCGIDPMIAQATLLFIGQAEQQRAQQ